jgi:hypothetical protein
MLSSSYFALALLQNDLRSSPILIWILRFTLMLPQGSIVRCSASIQ